MDFIARSQRDLAQKTELPAKRGLKGASQLQMQIEGEHCPIVGTNSRSPLPKPSEKLAMPTQSGFINSE